MTPRPHNLTMRVTELSCPGFKLHSIGNITIDGNDRLEFPTDSSLGARNTTVVLPISRRHERLIYSRISSLSTASVKELANLHPADVEGSTEIQRHSFAVAYILGAMGGIVTNESMRKGVAPMAETCS